MGGVFDRVFNIMGACSTQVEYIFCCLFTPPQLSVSYGCVQNKIFQSNPNISPNLCSISKVKGDSNVKVPGKLHTTERTAAEFGATKIGRWVGKAADLIHFPRVGRKKISRIGRI
ncbi:hypothetical protein MTR_8g089945 [Medicago truncatula]|uniref:Uncharacterized protein n=1 Tax=Medicago truncatula TaxID=3880 RepID=A0A072U4N8_MEDTR|nr:hypothetical protein MTR_8g089945 [Medicago truncatula]